MAGNSHGHTPAAWTGVTIAFIGFLVAGVFTVLGQPVGLVAGLVVVALGGVVGAIMRSAGLGQPKSHNNGLTTAQAAPTARSEQHARVQDEKQRQAS